MLKDSKALSGFSAGDIPKLKNFMQVHLGWTFQSLTACSRCSWLVATT
jgi:hypothetical protein